MGDTSMSIKTDSFSVFPILVSPMHAAIHDIQNDVWQNCLLDISADNFSSGKAKSC
jgi:hypothetical protein